MAPRRGGLFRGFLRSIQDWWDGESPEPERVPPEEIPPPQPPRIPPSGVTGAPDEHETRMRLIYLRIREQAKDSQDLTDYPAWRDTFRNFEAIYIYPDDSPESNDRRVERYWREYLRAFYLTTHEPGHMKRQTFYRRSGIPRDRIDWSQWRDLRRGTP